MSGSKPLRRVRAFQVAALVYNLGSFIYHAVIGGVAGMILGAACIAALAVGIRWITGKIGYLDALDRPRPDYSAIAAMERDIYGETFGHDGAPDIAARARPAGRTECRRCGYRYRPGDFGTCRECSRQRHERQRREADCDEHRSNLRWERRS